MFDERLLQEGPYVPFDGLDSERDQALDDLEEVTGFRFPADARRLLAEFGGRELGGDDDLIQVVVPNPHDPTRFGSVQPEGAISTG